MNYLKSGVITTGIAAILICSGAITETIRTDRFNASTDSSRWGNQPKELQEKLIKSWSGGIEAIRDTLDEHDEKENITEWKLFNSLEDSLTTLPHKEQSSFIAAYYSNERRTMLEKGDIMPALLLHPDHTKAILFWEKHDETYAMIMMDTRINENGKDEWYVSRSQKINKP
ncbi:MAG TPA: hypothetical protein DEF35_19875 [Paenibacillus sp.]|uniref:hypothetical protein n=1 Tax=Paenibacillus TaxID=44249 RepID=UPI000BA133CE|nr:MULTISPECIES: hypothetical protein [Paenibacillus]OZQ65259.1 hypothetical protein CA599_20890 [Paenibacillus taichungensis]HBU83877.1 hypothetical protein [Paenibacillus sp.]